MASGKWLSVKKYDQLPLLLDVKDLLTQVKILDKDRHYQRIAKGILEQCSYNDIYLQNDAEKAEEIIGKVKDAYNSYLNREVVIETLDSPIYGETA